MVTAIGLVSLCTPFLSPKYRNIWFTWPGLWAALFIPVVVLGLAWLLWRSIGQGHDASPFLLALGLFALSLIGLAVSLWPDLVPGRISLWDAAAPQSSQAFMLVGACILMPIILAYTAWAYWVFRGKVANEGYH